MAAKTVLNYLPRESVIHKMTGTTKLAFFLLFTFASMITYNTWVLLGLLVVSLLAFRLSRIKFREVRFMMTFMLVFLLLNNLFIFLFDPNQGTTLYGNRTVLCRCGKSANKPYCDGTHAAVKWRDGLAGEPVGERLPEEVC